MTEHPDELQVAIRAFSVVCFFVFFFSNGIHESVRRHGVKKVTVSATPSNGKPFAFSLDGFVLI